MSSTKTIVRHEGIYGQKNEVEITDYSDGAFGVIFKNVDIEGILEEVAVGVYVSYPNIMRIGGVVVVKITTKENSQYREDSIHIDGNEIVAFGSGEHQNWEREYKNRQEIRGWRKVKTINQPTKRRF